MERGGKMCTEQVRSEIKKAVEEKFKAKKTFTSREITTMVREKVGKDVFIKIIEVGTEINSLWQKGAFPDGWVCQRVKSSEAKESGTYGLYRYSDWAKKVALKLKEESAVNGATFKAELDDPNPAKKSSEAKESGTFATWIATRDAAWDAARDREAARDAALRASQDAAIARADLSGDSDVRNDEDGLTRDYDIYESGT